MTNSSREAYQAYRREFRTLRENGCRLYCPEDVEVSPDDLARTISRDRHATYMRDMICDREGRPVRINFMRVNL